MSKFIERLFNYGKKLVEREKEKYLTILKARAKIENVDLIIPENKEDL